jgi:hypothetical protein
MKWKKRVDLADPVPVPELLRSRLQRKLRGCRAIDIREEVAHNKYLQCNRIDLSNKSATTFPEEALDEIAEALATAMHGRWLENYEDEDNPEPLRFRMEAIKHKDCPKSQEGFGYTWDPEGADKHAWDDPEEVARAEALDHFRALVDRQLAYTEELHGVILKLANMNAEPIAASSNLAQWGGQMAMQGMQSQLASAKLNYDHEEARAKHEEETKRSEMRWTRVGSLLEVGVKAAATKLGAYLGDKRASKMRDAAKAAGVGDLFDTEAASSEPEAEPESDGEEESDTPITMLCDLFGRTLENKQRKALRDLVPELYPTFDDLFCVEDDDEAIALWDELTEALSLEQLLALNELMDDDQKALFAKVGELVASRKDDDDE